MKVYSRFHGLPSDRQNLLNIAATPRSKAQGMKTTPQKNICSWNQFSHMGHLIYSPSLSTHCTILGRKHIYSHLVHSQRIHILGHTTECNVALGQCSYSKTSGMVFCVSKGHKPLDGSLTYQILKMNTVHPQARLEFQLSEGRVNRLGRSDWHIGWVILDSQSQLGQKGLWGKQCFSLCLLSHPLALFHDGLRCSAIPSLSWGGSERAI